MSGVAELRRLTGVIPPTVTPLTADGDVDIQGLRRVVEFQLRQGVSGIFLLGSSGEFTGLTRAQRLEVVAAGREAVADRAPVLVGVSAEGTAVAVEFAREVARLTPTGLVSTPPFYYPYDGIEGAACLEFYRRLLDATDLPLFAYNNPRLARTAIPVETIRVLAEDARFAGLKESSADLRVFQRMLRSVGDRVAVLQGNDRLVVASAAVGGRAGVHASSNLLAWEFARLWEQATAPDRVDWPAVLDLQWRLATAADLLMSHPSPYALLKGVMERLSLCARWATSPFPQVSDEEIDSVCGRLRELGLWAGLEGFAEAARG